VVPCVFAASLWRAHANLPVRATVHRDPRYFHPEPHAFSPERWTVEGPSLAKARGQEFRLDKAAWMPFNYGPGNCIGRTLAMNEMRAVLAILVRRFDMRLAPGFEPSNWERNLVDGYALRRGPLPVVMSERT
jgi:cytochrome P450